MNPYRFFLSQSFLDDGRFFIIRNKLSHQIMAVLDLNRNHDSRPLLE
jgi:hypothetical protein